MESLTQYITSIVVVGILSALLLHLVNRKSVTTQLIKMMCGIFMIFVVISPLTRLSIGEYISFFEEIHWDALSVTAEGERYSQDRLRQSIKEKTEAYILDKAMLLGADIHVSVSCNTTDFPKPEYVELSGNASPYVKGKLQQIISKDIGIPEDNQIWT